MELKKRRHAYLTFLLLCLVAAAAIAGMSALLYQSGGSGQQVADGSESSEEQGDAREGDDGSENGAESDGSGRTAAENADENGGEAGTEGREAALENESKDGISTADGADADAEPEGLSKDADGDSLAAAGQTAEAVLAAKIDALSFAGETMVWPVDGEICLAYDMEHTIYFSTLDLYRCNPGICIQAEVGTPVYAGAEGVVTSVTADTYYGTMVTVALGDDYEVTCGQLGDVAVSVGEEVSASTQLGTVAEPTVYFTQEGAHLFLQITAAGECVDPLDYLNY